MTDQPSTQERERALNKMRAARFDAVALAKQHGDSLTPEQVDLIVGHGSQDVEGAQRDALGLKQPFETVPSTTQEAEKALEATHPAEGIAQANVRHVEALVAEVRSLRTQDTELRDEMQEWINATARARQDREAFREALDEQAERINALQLQHTKDQERIEEAEANVENLLAFLRETRDTMMTGAPGYQMAPIVDNVLRKFASDD